MRTSSDRAGKIAIKTLVVGTATLIGSAASVPWMLRQGERGELPISVSQIENGMLSTGGEAWLNVSPEPSNASAEAWNLTLPLQEPSARAIPSADLAEVGEEKTQAIKPFKKRSASNRELTQVRVFFATDRHQYRADSSHLWITTLVPCLLALAISCVMIAGCFVGRRRWAWGIGTGICLLISYVLVGQSVIKIGQLVRLAREGSTWFGTDRFEARQDYPLHLGTCDVTLPPHHRKGMIERPSVFTLEFKEREDRHVMVRRIDSLDAEDFFDRLSACIVSSDDRSALVYIHGYNVQFDEAIQRTAQLSKDIDFAGAPILYSWPSHGSLLRYHRDEANVEWSVAHLERFLADVHQRTGVKRLHVIAHSMGTRALVGAIQLLQLRYPQQQPMLSQVILAAPDIDADEFRDRFADAVKNVAARATLYASATDRALLASMQLHGHRRLGLTSSPQPTVAGVDLIDVTPVDTSLLGHSYYGSHPLMIRELVSIVRDARRPEERSWLTTLADQRLPPLWRFVPELAAQAAANY